MRRLRRYAAGGWAPRARGRFHMQREDQGQDFEIPHNWRVRAPGDGVVIAHGHDVPFPNGFGDPYAIVEIHSGRFAVGNGQWYIGHCNSDVPEVGHRFSEGDRLSRANNSLVPGLGWVELGKWDGGPHGMGEGAIWRHLFRPVWSRR